MGGKRHDQYRLDPGEGGATDYKFRHEDAQLHAEDRQRLADSREHASSLIPRRGENPALRAMRQRIREREGSAD